MAYGIYDWNPLTVRKFSRIWRKKMDGKFDLETLQYRKELILEMIQKETKKKLRIYRRSKPRPVRKSSNGSISRLLLNYDREVLAMIREINREFNHYLQYPHRYPYINKEKRRFLEIAHGGEDVMDIDVDINDGAFKDYWQKRAGILCDEKVKFEKRLLRRKWRLAVRNHLRLSKDPKVKDLQALLDSEVEDSEVEIIEHEPSIIYISSDEN